MDDKSWQKLCPLSEAALLNSCQVLTGDEDFLFWRGELFRVMGLLNLEPGSEIHGWEVENMVILKKVKEGSRAYRIIKPYLDNETFSNKVNLLAILHTSLVVQVQERRPTIQADKPPLELLPVKKKGLAQFSPESVRTRSKKGVIEKGSELFCEVVRGDLLAQNPYIVLKCGNQTRKTKIIKHNESSRVTWGVLNAESFIFPSAKIGRCTELKVQCYTCEKVRDAKVGTLVIPFTELMDNEQIEGWYELVPTTPRPSVPRLHLRLKIRKSESDEKNQSRFWQAIKNNDLETVKAEIAKPEKINWQETGFGGRTLVHLAIDSFELGSVYNCLRIVRGFLCLGANLLGSSADMKSKSRSRRISGGAFTVEAKEPHVLNGLLPSPTSPTVPNPV